MAKKKKEITAYGKIKLVKCFILLDVIETSYLKKVISFLEGIKVFDEFKVHYEGTDFKYIELKICPSVTCLGDFYFQTLKDICKYSLKFELIYEPNY